MVYQGSKNRIAKHLLPFIMNELTADRWYVEPFCGGCNLIDKVNHPKRMANDVNKYLIALFRHVQSGGFLPEQASRYAYYEAKNHKEYYPDWMVGFLGFLCSFRGKFFTCYWGEKKQKDGSVRNYIREQRNNLLKQINDLDGVVFTCSDYREMKIPPHSVIYCDPPYRGAAKYRDEIDHGMFWEWCREMARAGHTVFVSETEAPPDFKVLWEGELKGRIPTEEKTIVRPERLFRANPA